MMRTGKNGCENEERTDNGSHMKLYQIRKAGDTTARPTEADDVLRPQPKAGTSRAMDGREQWNLVQTGKAYSPVLIYQSIGK